MAEYLNPNIDPSDVTIDNIGAYDKQTTDVINQIENTDIPNMERSIVDYRNHIRSLPTYKQSCLEIKHLKGSISERNAIVEPINQTIFFIKS